MDYPGAVKDGKVLDQGEYDEQVEFATSVRGMIAGLPARPERAALEATAAGLLGAIRDRRSGEEVAAISGDLRHRIIDLYDVRVAPRQVPDLGPASQAKTVAASDNGAFALQGLAPGNYYVLAFDLMDGLEYADPDLLNRFLSRAIHVTLQPNEEQKISVELTKAGS